MKRALIAGIRGQDMIHAQSAFGWCIAGPLDEGHRGSIEGYLKNS